MAPSVDVEITANITRWPRPQRALDTARHHRPEDGQRADARDEQQLTGARPPAIARRRELDQHSEPRHAGHRRQVDLDLAEQLSMHLICQQAGRAHRVQRHHQRETA